MYLLILGFLTAFTITFLIIPEVIAVVHAKSLYDKPNARSAHSTPTPSLGGIAIFAGTTCGIIIWTPMEFFGVLQYLLAALVIVFLVGVLDDLTPITPTKKLIGQLIVAVIASYKANIRITGIYGYSGVTELPDLTSFVLSIVIIVGIINAFNLIDGINGLAGSVGFLSCVTFGLWFTYIDFISMAIVAFSLAGAILAFLKFNFTPSKIFMGDTGSLLIGTICATLTIQFIESNNALVKFGNLAIATRGSAAIALSVLIIPIFDTMRVFAIRLGRGGSPFEPDRLHIHHLLIDTGWSHSKATGVLLLINLAFILYAVSLRTYSSILIGLSEILLAILMVELFRFFHSRTANVPPPDNSDSNKHYGD